MKKGLVLEGGAMRGLFTAGIIDVMMEHGVWPDGLIGVSAGAAFGCNMKSRQVGRAIRYNKRFARDSRYSGVRSLLTTGDYFNAQFAYHVVPHKYDIFDNQAFEENPMEFVAVCTDVETGQPVYKRLDKCNEDTYDWIRASASMPLCSRVVCLEGYKLLDGGVSDSIPLEYAEQQGYERNVVILTQPEGFIKKQYKILPLAKIDLRHHQGAIRALEERPDRYNRQVRYVKDKEASGEIFVIRPPEALNIKPLTRDPAEIDRVYNMGLKAGRENLAGVKEFLSR